MNHREPAVAVKIESTEFYDENTLKKVHDVLDNIGSIGLTGEEIIGMLQNKGILFRERRP